MIATDVPPLADGLTVATIEILNFSRVRLVAGFALISAARRPRRGRRRHRSRGRSNSACDHEVKQIAPMHHRLGLPLHEYPSRTVKHECRHRGQAFQIAPSIPKNSEQAVCLQLPKRLFFSRVILTAVNAPRASCLYHIHVTTRLARRVAPTGLKSLTSSADNYESPHSRRRNHPCDFQQRRPPRPTASARNRSDIQSGTDG